MKQNKSKFTIDNKTNLTPWEVFNRIYRLLDGILFDKNETHQLFSFRDGIMLEIKRNNNDYKLKFYIDPKYRNKREGEVEVNGK